VASPPSVITPKPAINDHFKTGQRSRAQDMKLFYREGGTAGKLLVISFSERIMLRPDQREGAEYSCFPFIGRFGFGRVAGAKPPRGAGRSPDREGATAGITERLLWLPPLWCANCAGRI
jgi:hypothetical protein